MIGEWLELRATKLGSYHPGSLPYWMEKLFGVGVTSVSGVEVDPDSALRQSGVWRAVNLISGAVGFLPVGVYEQLPDGGKNRIRANPAARLLNRRANPFMSASALRETMMGHALTWGNGYAEIERDNGGRAIQLWLLLPNRTEPKLDENKRLFYEVTPKSGGSPKRLPWQNVLHLHGLGWDGLKGYSVISYAVDSIGLSLGAEKFAGGYFGRGATPGGVIQIPEKMDPEDRQKLKEDWAEMHKGLDNAHRVAILEEGAQWQQIGISAKDSQLLESRKFGLGDVSRWFGVPPHMLGDLERATFSNIEQQGIEFVTWSLAPWLKRWEDECAYKLLPADQQDTVFCEFITAALLKGDTASRFAAYMVGRQAGFLSINDIRRFENMNPIADGDDYLQPLNMVPVGETPPNGQDANGARALTGGNELESEHEDN